MLNITITIRFVKTGQGLTSALRRDMRAGGSGFAGRGKRINQPTKGKLAFISDSERMINCDLAGIHKNNLSIFSDF